MKRSIWKFVAKMREALRLILTTHAMDEAEATHGALESWQEAV